MPFCSYNPAHEMDTHHVGNQKLLRFPDGRKLDWRQVCADCLRMRHQWQEKRDIEQFQEAERKRVWHMEVAKRNDDRRAQIEANRVYREIVRSQRERAASLAERERELAEIIKLEQRLDELRKKHLTK